MSKINKSIHSLLLILISTFCIGCNSRTEQNKEKIKVVSWGGEYQDQLFKNWIIPSADNKIDIIGESYNGEYQNITRMVKYNAVRWDLIQVETFYAASAMNKGLLEKFDPAVPQEQIAIKDKYKYLRNYAIPTIAWSYVLCWNQNIIDNLNQSSPVGWSDFWDLSRYPGKRALRDVPQGNIEIALLADGMTQKEIEDRLYDAEDMSLVRRAFNKLDQIKRSIVWWSSGDEIERYLETGKVVMAASWNGRVWKARKDPIVKDKKMYDVRLNYQDAILDYDWWIIPKGSKNAKGAAELVNAMYHNKNGAILFSRKMGYGAPITGWTASLNDQDLINYMPTSNANLERQLTIDPLFWAKYNDRISEEWRAWRNQ